MTREQHSRDGRMFIAGERGAWSVFVDDEEVTLIPLPTRRAARKLIRLMKVVAMDRIISQLPEHMMELEAHGLCVICQRLEREQLDEIVPSVESDWDLDYQNGDDE